MITPDQARQCGVVTRGQLAAAGLAAPDLERLLRRRELVRLHRGVFVDHTGEPTWEQRAWAATLLLAPAALSHASALRAYEGTGSARPTDVIDLAVARGRRVRPPDGLRVHRIDGLDDRVAWHLGPPRQRYEEAVIDVAAAARDDLAAIAELAAAVQSHRTTAARLAEALGGRDRIARGTWMRAVLADVAAGACSVLEHGYLTRVERAHGLGGARRQVRTRTRAGVVYRDVEYACGLIVELDGRLHHGSAGQRDRDLERDLLAAVDGKQSVRLGYRQVFDRHCRTATSVAALLARRGERVDPRRCGVACSLRWSV